MIGAGTVVSIHGLFGITPTSSGLILPADDPLTDGDSYTVRAYVPDPTAQQMVASPPRYPHGLAQYTRIELPQGGSTTVPLRGGARPIGGAAARRDECPAATSRLLSHSPYRGMYGLAHRLTDGQPTSYDAVNAVEDYLRRNYTYNERPPQHRYPLRAFLFKDGRGYCQQFSGDDGADAAHGRDPEPRRGGLQPRHAQPWRRPLHGAGLRCPFLGRGLLQRHRLGRVRPDACRGAAEVAGERSRAAALPARHCEWKAIAAPGERAATSTSRRVAAVGRHELVVGNPLVGGADRAGPRVDRRRHRGGHSRDSLPLAAPAAAAEARLRELEAALPRLRSWTVGGTTLLALEHRFGSAAGPAAAGYAAKLRAARYAPLDPGQPTAAERRAMRRELTAGLGVRARLRGLLAIPPGGPSPV